MSDLTFYASIPAKRLKTDILSTDTNFKLRDIKWYTGSDAVDVNLTSSIFGPNNIGYGCFEPNTPRQEFFTFDATNMATAATTGLTILSRGLPWGSDYSTQATNRKFNHASGSIVLLETNAPAYYDTFANKNNDETIAGAWTFSSTNVPRASAAVTYGAGTEEYFATKRYVDSVVTGGAADASTTQKGLAEEATQAELEAGTAAGSAARLFMNPSTWIQTWQKHVTTGYTYGETITAGQTLYQKASDGKLYKTVTGIQSQGTLTYVGNVANNETIVIGATTYTYKTVLTGAANEIAIGASQADTQTNTAAAINANGTAGTQYGTGTVANASATAAVSGSTIIVTALLANDNTIVFTEAVANVTIDGSGTLGATTSGAPGGDSANLFIGIAIDAGVAADTGKRVQIGGIVTGLSGLTVGAAFLSDTAGAITATASSTYRKFIGYSLSTTTLLLMPGINQERFYEVGSGADGALSLSSGTTTINLSSAEILIKQYSSISITGTGQLAFSNPAATGSHIIFNVTGDVTITSTASPAIDLRSLGGAAGTAGAAVVNSATGNSGTDGSNGTVYPTSFYIGTLSDNGKKGLGADSGSGTAKAGGATASAPTLLYSTDDACIRRVLTQLMFRGAPGGGGGGGGSGNSGGASMTSGAGAAGGRGAGSMLIYCAGTYNRTGTVDASGANGSNATNASGTTNMGGGGGGGGGGAAGTFMALFSKCTSKKGTTTLTGGNGGNGSNPVSTGSGNGNAGSGASGGGNAWFSGGAGGQGGVDSVTLPADGTAGGGTGGTGGTKGTGGTGTYGAGNTCGAGGGGGGGAKGFSFEGFFTLAN